MIAGFCAYRFMLALSYGKAWPVIALGGLTGAADRDCQEEGWHSH